MVIECPQDLPLEAQFPASTPRMTAWEDSAAPVVAILVVGRTRPVPETEGSEVVVAPFPPDEAEVAEAEVGVTLDPGEAFELEPLWLLDTGAVPLGREDVCELRELEGDTPGLLGRRAELEPDPLGNGADSELLERPELETPVPLGGCTELDDPVP